MSKNAQRNVNLLMIFFGLVILAFAVYVLSRVYATETPLIPISVFAIIAGAIFEAIRISEKWTTVLKTASGALVLSLFSLLPRKRENDYDFDRHIEQLPYWFIVIFALITIAVHRNQIIPKLTEGITLLQSIAIVYWVVDYGFVDTNSFLLKTGMVAGLLFSAFSLFNAFTHATLSRTNRLLLSVWSSLIMLVFAVDNIYRTFQNEQIENTAGITNGIYIGLQFFLLGVSSIYVVQNFLMLGGFLPGKKTFFNREYSQRVKALKGDHIDRYSDQQVNILHSLFCLIFTGTVFTLNYRYQLVPRHVAIWMVFVVFPIIVSIFSFFTRRKN